MDCWELGNRAPPCTLLPVLFCGGFLSLFVMLLNEACGAISNDLVFPDLSHVHS